MSYTIYVIHHSHTDIGYTDTQEKVIYNQIDYIRSAMRILCDKQMKDFKWNCESYFIVEEFLKHAGEDEKNLFYDLVRKGSIGLSANYLNFTDLADAEILMKTGKRMAQTCRDNGIVLNAAMNADINGISQGALNALAENGVAFLYTNIHTHHGMYPLFQNQNSFFWETQNGKRVLVFNGEHYNIGNALGLTADGADSCMAEKYFGIAPEGMQLSRLKHNISLYLDACVKSGYTYDFLPVSVSGLVSDNAPPNADILKTIRAFNDTYGHEIRFEMVTLSQLYDKIKDKLADVPVYRGDLNDWWASGVGSTPYALKHYRQAQRLCRDVQALAEPGEADKQAMAEAETNMLLFAEHTWGYSSSVTNPFDTCVQTLDMTKSMYAARAYSLYTKEFCRLCHHRGDKLRYYETDGEIKVINPSAAAGRFPFSFYIEQSDIQNMQLVNADTGEQIACQVSPHPRGVLISASDCFQGKEEKTYQYKKISQPETAINTRVAYIGMECVKDVVNTYDTSYRLSYGMENDYFKITYKTGEGITGFYNKTDGIEMYNRESAPFFTPIYECTEIRTDVRREREKLGRNIRGLHAKQYYAQLTDIKPLETGEVFDSTELVYELPSTRYCSVVIKMYHGMPVIDFTLKIAKELSDAIESVYLPLQLEIPGRTLHIEKGGAMMRPGLDQLPGTCMEYYLLDRGVVYAGEKADISIIPYDAPLIYMGELAHHPITLCTNCMENNRRNLYSWVMNNLWETNFKLDLSGIAEYRYRLELSAHADAAQSLSKADNGLICLIV